MVTQQNLYRPIKNKQNIKCNQLMKQILWYSTIAAGGTSHPVHNYGVDGARHIITSVHINILL